MLFGERSERARVSSTCTYQWLGQLLDDLDLVIAENMMERIEGRIMRMLFYFDGHQVEIGLVARIVPTFHFGSKLFTLQPKWNVPVSTINHTITIRHQLISNFFDRLVNN